VIRAQGQREGARTFPRPCKSGRGLPVWPPFMPKRGGEGHAPAVDLYVAGKKKGGPH
jgi:hypothetical protein